MSPRTLAAWLRVFEELRRRDNSKPDPEALGKKLAQLVEEEETHA